MIWRLCGVAIITSGAYVFLKKEKPEYAFFAQTGGTVLLLLLLMPSIEQATMSFSALFKGAGIDGAYIKILLRSLGLAILTKLIADVCRDSGESALASKVELGGKVLILVGALPVFQAILELITGLLETV